MTSYKILFFDLDGTLLTSNKEISKRTERAILRCKEKGLKIGICTSRSAYNSLPFFSSITPDVVIASGGALVQAEGKYILKKEFSIEETREIIQKSRCLLGNDCEITVDTIKAHYWNYKTDPSLTENNWGGSIYSDFVDFNLPSLKICVEILDRSKEKPFYACFSQYDCIKFSDGNWVKITQKNGTKEEAIRKVLAHYHLQTEEAVSFGDDTADIGMLKMSGLGIAMGNSFQGVKESADIVIGSNDQEGIAIFLEENFL